MLLASREPYSLLESEGAPSGEVKSPVSVGSAAAAGAVLTPVVLKLRGEKPHSELGLAAALRCSLAARWNLQTCGQ